MFKRIAVTLVLGICLGLPFGNFHVRATETEPLRYVATLTQSGTDAPVAHVIHNTIGEIVWQRNNVGRYQAVLTDGFPVGHVTAKGCTFIERVNEHLIVAEFDINASDSDTLQFSVQSRDSGYAQGVEDVLLDTPIEITVYSH